MRRMRCWAVIGLAIALSGCQTAAPAPTPTPRPTPTIDLEALLERSPTPVIPITMSGAARSEISYLAHTASTGWEQTPVPDSIHLTGMYVINHDTAFVFGSLLYQPTMHDPLLLRTGDGGKHWQEIKLPESTYNTSVFQAAFVNQGIGWLLVCPDVEDYSCGDLYTTADYGVTWKKLPAIGTWGFHPWGMEFSGAQNGQITFDQTTASPYDHFGVMSTTDGGQTWHETQQLPLGSRLSMEHLDDLKALYAGPAGGAWGAYWYETLLRGLPYAVDFDGTAWGAFGQGDDIIIAYRRTPGDGWTAASILNRKVSVSTLPTESPTP